MDQSPTGYDVGALMYSPANAHGTIVDALKNERIPHPFSLAFHKKPEFETGNLLF